MEETHRARYEGKGGPSSLPSPGMVLSKHPEVFTDSETLWILLFRSICKFHYIGSLITSLGIVDWTQTPASPTACEVGFGHRLPILSSPGWFLGLQPSSWSCLGAHQESPPWHQLRHGWKGLFWLTLIIQEIQGILEVLCRGQRPSIFFIILYLQMLINVNA